MAGETGQEPLALRFRTIEPRRDADLVAAYAHEAWVVSFGEEQGDRLFDREGFLGFVRWGVAAFPDGFVLAYEDTAPEARCVGLVLLDVRDAAQVGSDDLDGPIAYAHLYYIAPEFRGTGASNTLQRYVDEFARRRNTRAIELNVEPGNTRAVRYYRRVGYRVARQILRWGVPMFRMRKMIES